MRAGLDPLAVALAAVDGNEGAAPELIESLYGAHAAAARRQIAAEIKCDKESHLREWIEEVAYDRCARVANGGPR